MSCRGHTPRPRHYHQPVRDIPWVAPSSPTSRSVDKFIKQPLGLFLDAPDVSADFFECAQRLRLVEVPREADLVADLGSVFLDPRVGRVGQHLAADERFDTALL